LRFDRARTVLAGHYSRKGRPSIDPELMLRMLLVGYAYGIRSERQLCAEVHLNLAYRWFCRLGLEGAVPNHSTFSKNRHSRFRESDVYLAPESPPHVVLTEPEMRDYLELLNPSGLLEKEINQITSYSMKSWPLMSSTCTNIHA
jgi:hypothetical protein